MHARWAKFVATCCSNGSGLVWAALGSWVVSLCVTWALATPVPRVHDEFAYLLGADTYASGRLCNSPHPHWQHFESFHILSQPNYLPKYPALQSLALAAGQLLGHPILGVHLSTALLSASLLWMLCCWLPKRYVWLCWLISVLHPGVQIKWGHSYMGGTLAMLGSCLLLGALGRVIQASSLSNKADAAGPPQWQIKLTAIDSLLAALGILILANSRPFEGAVLTSVTCLSAVWVYKNQQTERRTDSIRFRQSIPAIVLLILGAGAMMFNNSVVTGKVTQLPYQLYELQYGKTPLFLWQSPKFDSSIPTIDQLPQPQYRHAVFQRYYDAEDTEIREKFSSLIGIARTKLIAIAGVIHFFCGGTEFLIIACLPWLINQARYRLIMAILAPTLLAAAATPWTWTHYAAPAAPFLLVLTIAAVVKVIDLVWNLSRSSRLLLSVGLVTVFCNHAATLTYKEIQIEAIPWPKQRQDICQLLNQQPGRDLVFVNYSSEHNPHHEWVYNAACIDLADVVWARRMTSEQDQRLVDYFSDRNVWQVDADAAHPKLIPINLQQR